jgi:pyridoxamine 5'-phosphate oxidase
MNQSIANIRNEYCMNGLHEADLDPDPIKQFQKWFDDVVKAEIDEPNAMYLSTINHLRPSARIVLLKGVDEQGFTFFTNYNSRKGLEIKANAQVAITFFWKELERQVRIEGQVQKTSPEESDKYFASRPRGSQIGAWISDQSQTIESREYLEQKQQAFIDQFAGMAVPRPLHWGGYRVIPDYVEFWQGRPSRLHDRLSYVLQPNGTWNIERLSP